MCSLQQSVKKYASAETSFDWHLTRSEVVAGLRFLVSLLERMAFPEIDQVRNLRSAQSETKRSGSSKSERAPRLFIRRLHIGPTMPWKHP